MTEEELVEVAAAALALATPCPADEWADINEEAKERYRRYARAVLAAVEPKIRADERERAARIAEDRNAGLDQPDGGAPTPREMCLNIAAAIRGGKEE